MTRFMRNSIRVSSIACALLAFALINLDSTPKEMPGWIHQSTWSERLIESLLIAPIAFVGGATYGFFFAVAVSFLRDVVRWIKPNDLVGRDG